MSSFGSGGKQIDKEVYESMDAVVFSVVVLMLCAFYFLSFLFDK